MSHIKNSRKVFNTSQTAGGGGSGIVQSVVAGTGITVDNTDPANPIVSSTGADITVVANYSALPAVGTVTDQFYWCSASQGTKWLPGSLGGTYYSAGLYYSNGVSWEFLDVPYQATQATVDTGTNTDQFVTPSTLTNATVITNKALKNNTVLSSYLEIPEQAAPSSPTNAIRLFADTSNRFGWKGENGYVRTFDGTGNTADRVYTLPNASGNIVLDSATQTLTNKSGNNSQWTNDSNFIKSVTYTDYTTFNPADSTTIYSRNINNSTWNTGNTFQEKIPVASTKLLISLTMWVTGTLGSNEDSTVTLFNATAGTSEVLSTTFKLNAVNNILHVYSTLSFSANDMYYITITTPAWATNPTAVFSRLIIQVC
jgi:hypothetical protein